MKKARNTPSGSKRMKETGKARIELWVSADELDQLGDAAVLASLPLATLVRKLAIEAAYDFVYKWRRGERTAV